VDKQLWLRAWKQESGKKGDPNEVASEKLPSMHEQEKGGGRGRHEGGRRDDESHVWEAQKVAEGVSQDAGQ
jgi:hypothetical protein